MTEQKRLIFVTGMSGAGISSTLSVFRDLGYDVFDNFPLFLVKELLNDLGDSQAIAIGLDCKTRGFQEKDFESLLRNVKSDKTYTAEALFIDSSLDVLERRYVETKRRHPLSAKDHSIHEGIIHEKDLMDPFRKHMDRIIDTSDFSVYDLRNMIEQQYAFQEQHDIHVTVLSFGYKYGMPNHADRVEDVRFLENPYWQNDLKHMTGQDRDVQSYIRNDDNFKPFLKKTTEMLEYILPLYKKEGKNYITLAFGCTGGRHRSVFVAETITKFLKSKEYSVSLSHRDIGH